MGFDFSFNLESDDRMYCSEMVSKALTRASKRIQIEPSKLTSAEADFLSAYAHLPRARTNKLQFIPIDALYLNPNCQLVKALKYDCFSQNAARLKARSLPQLPHFLLFDYFPSGKVARPKQFISKRNLQIISSLPTLGIGPQIEPNLFIPDNQMSHNRTASPIGIWILYNKADTNGIGTIIPTFRKYSDYEVPVRRV